MFEIAVLIFHNYLIVTRRRSEMSLRPLLVDIIIRFRVIIDFANSTLPLSMYIYVYRYIFDDYIERTLFRRCEFNNSVPVPV